MKLLFKIAHGDGGMVIIYLELYGKTLQTAGVLIEDFALGCKPRNMSPNCGYVGFVKLFLSAHNRRLSRVVCSRACGFY
jgi:hypothetical protein